MRVIEYNNANDITVEFQDKYKAKVHTSWRYFRNGNIKNPYYPSVYGVGMVGNKYPVGENWKDTKEYKAWHHILERCYDNKLKEKRPTYQDAVCCDEWLCFENFYKWLHSQDNFDKWYFGNRWAVDKDILVKGNKVYSPETCCLVPDYINVVFAQRHRGKLPTGVTINYQRYQAGCTNPFTKKREYLGTYDTMEEAFQKYKQRKEEIIKQIAEREYVNGNIVRQCYEAMTKYQVESED